MTTKNGIVSFGNHTAADRKLLKCFVDFHWNHYLGEPRYVPLLDYEYLGSSLLGMVGFFEPKNLFFKHGDTRFFLAMKDGQVVGRCNAFVNTHHNEHAKDKTGFFGNFECIEDPAIAKELLAAAESWLREKGMDHIRGPQNFPVNEATPGFLVEGFESRPVIYYHNNKPYYKDLALANGYKPTMHFLSWECDVQNNPIDANFQKICQKIIERYGITIEHWGERPYKVRREEMFTIYNDAWNDNYGFVPFTREEFFKIVQDMQLVMDKRLFLFVYVKGESAAFFGGVPNIFEPMSTDGKPRGSELIRAVKMILKKSKIRGFRLGYLGVKKKFRGMGLDALMLWKQGQVSKKLGYQYCDLGWVLETNKLVISMAERCGSVPSKKYAIFEKSL